MQNKCPIKFGKGKRKEGRTERQDFTTLTILLLIFFYGHSLKYFTYDRSLSISLLLKNNGQTHHLLKKKSEKSYNSRASNFRVRRVRMRQIHN